jgi:hypothetical protein
MLFICSVVISVKILIADPRTDKTGQAGKNSQYRLPRQDSQEKTARKDSLCQ